jgi:hypothetical protein
MAPVIGDGNRDFGGFFRIVFIGKVMGRVYGSRDHD